ncbi:hypothetical protein [Thermodesulfatator autotrophicus]|uniref:Uncharacterized protein n=1 Tax=Thermodesulfatator autotrophicus TaxID=1795632 RepID=A0A177E6F9_9BACT|nr:hypothetical protein [Thermodesulfatator autotrophicus]OAG27030.1 hypothetical protein TH606_09115 [Thermodesulfatator autotrophicus]
MANHHTFNQSLQDTLSFLNHQNNPPYFLYCNFTNKYVSIHSGSSPNIPTNYPQNRAEIFEKTDNGFWYGPISSYQEALAIAIIMADFHHLNYGEYINVISRNDITYPNNHRPR